MATLEAARDAPPCELREPSGPEEQMDEAFTPQISPENAESRSAWAELINSVDFRSENARESIRRSRVALNAVRTFSDAGRKDHDQADGDSSQNESEGDHLIQRVKKAHAPSFSGEAELLDDDENLEELFEQEKARSEAERKRLEEKKKARKRSAASSHKVPKWVDALSRRKVKDPAEVCGHGNDMLLLSTAATYNVGKTQLSFLEPLLPRWETDADAGMNALYQRN
eukprot:TRINITY_DN8745_c0_g2_i1.p1 TRINITY_DN8745_c0_g2~~TRINITY_DN8745_c0_g2_i1.p1  ORF type:complete len:245 (-),score=49.86 TRINITY_DN8745_c0_g2_i1:306-986(-)